MKEDKLCVAAAIITRAVNSTTQANIMFSLTINEAGVWRHQR